MNSEHYQTTNRVYKDRLFCSIFGKEENKPFLLELYNALNHSNYSNVNDIEFTTIENVIYITMKNDVSFLIGNELNLYEHQSSFNPNLPLRGLMYFAQLYQRYLTEKDKDLYSTTLIKIPNPKFIVFYNGNKEIDDITRLKLSDAFFKQDDTKNFEWTATVININKNHNTNLLNSCKSLYHYSEFVSMVKQNLKLCNNRQEAIGKALNVAIKNNFFNGYLKKSKMEVLNMSLTEFDQEEYDRHRREEGIIEGRTEAILETAKNFLKMNLPIEQIALGTGLPISEIELLKD